MDQLDLNPRITAAVKKGRLKSVKEVLCYSGPDLQRLTSLPTHDVQHLLRAAALHLQGSHVLTALQLFQQRERFPEQHQRLSLGCPVLDQFLGGGLPLEGITDLAGRSSAGKTQLALQLCLTVQFPRQYGGLEAGEWLPLPGSVGKSWSKAGSTQAPCSGLLSSQGGIAVSWVVSITVFPLLED